MEGDGGYAKCERDSRTSDGYHNEGQPTPPTWPTVAPAGPAVSVDELEELDQDGQDVITQVHPVPGTDDHNYGQCSRRKATSTMSFPLHYPRDLRFAKVPSSCDHHGISNSAELSRDDLLLL